MARSSVRAAAYLLAGIFAGSIGFALRAQNSPPVLQSTNDPRVSIVPRPSREAARRAGDAPTPDIRVDSSLVLIPVHVTTPSGTTITDLQREDFRISENGVEQKISYFSQEDAPLSIGLVFDTSGSMQNKMRKVAKAASAFLQTANAQDEFFLVEFSDRAKMAMPFTPDSDEIYKRIEHTRPFGRTSLFDAIHLALAEMKHARNPRKAMVILSDGGDNRSRSTEAEVRNAMLESDVQMQAMGIFDPVDAKTKISPEERNGPALLSELAEHTGGQLYRVDSLDDLPSVSAHISDELRSQYLLGYFSTDNARDGKYRQVKLDLLGARGSADLRRYYRHGYYAPAD